MAKNLFDFASQNKDDNNFSQEKLDDMAKKIDKNTMTSAEDFYEKYKNYSQEDLMGEFVKTSKEKLKDGTLSIEKLQNAMSNLSPYLNTDQKELFENLMRKLNE